MTFLEARQGVAAQQKASRPIERRDASVFQGVSREAACPPACTSR